MLQACPGELARAPHTGAALKKRGDQPRYALALRCCRDLSQEPSSSMVSQISSATEVTLRIQPATGLSAALVIKMAPAVNGTTERKNGTHESTTRERDPPSSPSRYRRTEP